MSNLSTSNPVELPNFKAGFFSDNTELRDSWLSLTTTVHPFLGDRYWHIQDGGSLNAPKAVGLIIVGVTVAYPEFVGIGSRCIPGEGVTNEVSYLSLTTNSSTHFYDRDRTAINLIEATNEQLAALNSPYHLPIL